MTWRKFNEEHVVFLQNVEERFRELDHERSILNDKLSSDKNEYEKRLRQIDFERQEMLEKTRVKDKSNERTNSFLLF